MKKVDQHKIIINPKNQLNLYGYRHYFDTFVKLYKKHEIPNTLLISGPKGIGKATFLYHFFNYVLSQNEKNKYDISNMKIHSENLSYNRLLANTHPNFFLVDSQDTNKEIKIDTIRNLITFLSKSTYSSDLKIVLIDNAENMNLYSSNALLKAIEEPKKNTFFFIVQDSKHKILETIKSRSTEFKIFFTKMEKEYILIELINFYYDNCTSSKFMENLYFDTPGNILKYLSVLEENNTALDENIMSNINFFIEKYKKDKNSETLSYISFFIEKFYNKLCLSSKEKFQFHIFNYIKILKILNEMKKFNLNDKNSFIKINDILINETK